MNLLERFHHPHLQLVPRLDEYDARSDVDRDAADEHAVIADPADDVLSCVRTAWVTHRQCIALSKISRDTGLSLGTVWVIVERLVRDGRAHYADGDEWYVGYGPQP